MKLSSLINARVPSDVEYLVVKRFRRRLYNFVICFSQVGVPLMSYMFYSQKIRRSTHLRMIEKIIRKFDVDS